MLLNRLVRSGLIRPSLIGLLALIPALPGFAAERVISDALGNRVSVKEHPARIVTLMPSLGELAAEFLTDLSGLIGVSDSTGYPPALKKVASIGPYQRFSIETVVSLRPDLVLASYNGNAKDQVDHLRELGIPVLIVKTDTFEECADSIRLVGDALGHADQGKKLAETFMAGVSRIRKRGQARALNPSFVRPRVLLEVGDEPVVAVGGRTLLDSSLDAVGAVNIYADSSSAYPRPSIEDVARRAPDVIIALALSEDTTALQRSLTHWNALTSIPAVRNKRIYLMKADSLLRPSMRLVEGLGKLELALFGSQK